MVMSDDDDDHASPGADSLWRPRPAQALRCAPAPWRASSVFTQQSRAASTSANLYLKRKRSGWRDRCQFTYL
ncbi:hypothetical protein BX600DRAFT_451416 [Xylariales sp. PMI_506]|nr:hypothetical protein BX600DRAFT_451416 [Xylariales sp. PMI_506]